MKVIRVPDKVTKTLTFMVLSESRQHTNESNKGHVVYVIAHCTSQFLCQASEDSCGISVFSGVESILSCYSRTQTQQVGEFLESILERENVVQNNTKV